MVEIHTEGDHKLLVLTPNKSMTWETNKKILWVMFAVNLLIGISFAAIGAWLILPFAGIEVLLVGAGMYYVCWKLNFQETISLDGDQLKLQKGVYYPKRSWHWQKQQTVLYKKPSVYRMSAPTLTLKHNNEEVEIGEFLNRQEKILLRESLADWAIPVVNLPKKSSD